MYTYSVYVNGLLWATGMDMETAFALSCEAEVELKCEKEEENT